MAKKQKVSKLGTVVSVEYPTLRKTISLDVSKLSAAMQLQGLLHGIAQKLGDAESGGSPAEKHAMASRIIEGLKADQWELTSTPDHSGIVIEAVCRLQKLPEAKVRKAVEGKPEKIKEWASNAKVKAEVAKIRLERAEKAAEEADEIEIEI